MESTRSSSPADEIKNWNPEPLVPEVDAKSNYHILNPHIVTSKAGKYITVNGVQCLNCATHNYLGLADDPRLELVSIEATNKYGVGSCGPRGFYGTMDVHLKLEENLAKFLGVQEAVLYSYGFSTIASAIPAYAKSTDIVFVDELCNFSIQQGIVASRSRVLKFRHNDIKHLRQLIEEVMEEQLKKYGRTNKVRTFIIVEGIYAKTGSMCPLVELVKLKQEFKIRLFIDESLSFGVLGTKGKGITEYYDVNIDDIDMIMGSLEYALCAYGGFCAGSTYVVDHQRLAGVGYCFSASLPPLQVGVALETLNIISSEPEIVGNARSKFEYAHQISNTLSLLKDISHPHSPIKVLVLRSSFAGGDFTDVKYDKAEEDLLSDICEEILTKERIALTVARYLADDEMSCPLASIRLAISSSLDRSDIERIFRVIERSTSIRGSVISA